MTRLIDLILGDLIFFQIFWSVLYLGVQEGNFKLTKFILIKSCYLLVLSTVPF